VATIFAGYLSDRFGREPVIIGGFFLASVCLVLYTLITTIEGIVVIGIVDGLGSGMVSTTLMVFLSDLVEPRVIGGAVGLYRTFMDLGGIIGPLVVMTLFAAMGPIIPFFVAAGLTLVNLALITVTWLRTRSAA
jgi:MFS family permease